MTKGVSYPLGAPIPCVPGQQIEECKQVNLANGVKWNDRTNSPVSPTMSESIGLSLGNLKQMSGECRTQMSTCVSIAGAIVGAVELNAVQKVALQSAQYDAKAMVLVFGREQDRLVLEKVALVIFKKI